MDKLDLFIYIFPSRYNADLDNRTGSNVKQYKRI
jgi:hypothetical protein